MLEFIENVAYIIRNILIYSNEAYIWKMTSSSTTFQNVGLLTNREKSAQLAMTLNKIDPEDKNILAQFHTTVITLLGRRLIQLILMDYFEPVYIPEEKDMQSVFKFLNAFSTDVVDPCTLWNQDTKNELKIRLKEQIS